jgi:hypothetical protein
MNLSELDRVQLPYGQLTSFPGTSFNTTECLFILAQTPTLVDCVFYVCSSNRVAPVVTSFSSISTLAHLKSLKLFTTGLNAYAISIFGRLTLPSVETLVLGHGGEDTVSYFTQSFPWFIRRSNSHFSGHS